MYRKVILAVLAVLMCLSGFAREGKKRWQIEPYVGVTMPLAREDGMKGFPFVATGVGYRHALGNGVFWIGGEFSLQSAARKYSILREDYQSDMQGCRMISLCFVGEAHFAEVGKVGFYGGVGAGIAQCLSSKFEFNAERPLGPVVKPYVGIECWNHLRVGVEGVFASKYFNTVNLRVGWAF